MPYQSYASRVDKKRKQDNLLTYPLLMKSSYSGIIILMTAYGKGTVKGTGNKGVRNHSIGEECVSLNMHNFYPLKYNL